MKPVASKFSGFGKSFWDLSFDSGADHHMPRALHRCHNLGAKDCQCASLGPMRS